MATQTVLLSVGGQVFADGAFVGALFGVTLGWGLLIPINTATRWQYALPAAAIPLFFGGLSALLAVLRMQPLGPVIELTAGIALWTSLQYGILAIIIPKLPSLTGES